MGDLAVRFMQTRRKPEKPVPAGEQKALDRLRLEAKRHGATLHSGGEGGLPSSTVLGILRRDEYRCHKCGGREDLTMHHKADTFASPYLRRLHASTKRSDPKGIVTICQKCHDSVHEEARREGTEQDNQK